jgi:hypothetical protein
MIASKTLEQGQGLVQGQGQEAIKQEEEQAVAATRALHFVEIARRSNP